MPDRASPPLDGALCEALDEFTKLCIDAFPFQTSTDNDKVLQQPSTSKSSESMENCKKQAVKDEKEKAKYYHRRFRYSPYSVPKSTSKSERKADPVFTALGKIKLKGDVDKLRHCLLDRMLVFSSFYYSTEFQQSNS
ncbi:hypothetical protein WR25_21647 isoform B [Diploscapter pachys]|uniref:Uncharacterized protein n=1 Tax=Diploscapter pachys TaxID=2018661 RepID=A0A2A2K834_9BILA|nr:hypothetical protein WR25_21647 isoform B [Diploscapter pachys]